MILAARGPLTVVMEALPRGPVDPRSIPLRSSQPWGDGVCGVLLKRGSSTCF